MSLPLRSDGRRVNAAPKSGKPAASKTAKGKAVEASNRWSEDELRRSLGLVDGEAVEPRRAVYLASSHLVEASNVLSSMMESGKSESEVVAIAKSCRVALEAARRWSDKKLEVERRASSICSKLIALDAMDRARELLNEMRPCLLELYRHGDASTSPFSLPLPLDQDINPELLNLLTATLVHQLYVNQQHPDYVASLFIPGSFSSWLQFTPPDSTIRRGYSALSKHPAFASKIASLKCILKSAELEADAFWGQTVQFGSAQAKTAGTDAARQLEAAREVSGMYDEIVNLASERKHFLEGENFVKFCKHWTSFARRLQDHQVLEKVSKYLEASPAHDYALESAQLCARLLRLNSSLSSPSSLFSQHAAECISILATPNYKKVLNDSQVMSEMDRLRRSATKFLDGENVASVEESVKESVASLIFHLVRPDRLNFSLDSIIVLARTTLVPRETRTWSLAFDYLQKGYDLLYSNSKPIAASNPTIDGAMFLRALANAYSNSGGSLYGEERYGAATRFLVRATQVMTDSISVYASCTVEKSSESKADWEAFEKRFIRIFEVLGRCYIKMGERRNAYDAYCSALRASLLCDPQTIPLSEANRLLIERITNIGFSDLFLDAEEISLQTTLSKDTSLTDKLAPEVIAAVLEIQINFLRHYISKKNVEELIRSLIAECIGIYGEKMPVRRARVHLQLLELLFLSNSESIDAREVGRQVEEMAVLKALNDDAPLAVLQKLYLASASGWLALISHTRRESIALPDQEILEHIAKAANAMHELKLAVLAPPPVPVGRGKSKALAKSAAVKRGAKATSAAKAPRRGKPAASEESNAVAVEAVVTEGGVRQSAMLKEGCDYAFHVLDVVAQFSGLMGHLVQRVQILDALREVAKTMPEQMPVHVSASLQLARELFHLGMVTAAQSIHDSLAATLKSRDIQIPQELGVLVLLAQAEIASTSDLAEGNKLYSQAFESTERLSDADSSAIRLPADVLSAKIETLERAASAVSVYGAIVDAQSNVHGTLQFQQQSMRLWSKAADYLSRYATLESPAKPARSPSPDPFNVASLKEAVQEMASESKPPPGANIPEAWRSFHRARTLHGAEWRVAFGLLNALYIIIESYIRRGSVKTVFRLIDDAEGLAQAMGSRALLARGLIRKGELLVLTGELEEGYRTLVEARDALSTVTSSETADVHRVLGVYHATRNHTEDADDMFNEGITRLQALEQLIGDASRASSQESKEVFAGNLVAEILRESVWLCRQEQHGEDFMGALELLVDSSQSPLSQGLLHLLTGKLAMHGVHEYFSGSLCLSSLTESTISLPLGMTGTQLRTTPSTAKVTELLSEAEGAFEKSMTILHRRGTVGNAREAAVSFVLSRAFQTSLGSAAQSDSIVLSNILDVSCSMTLARELVEAIDNKLSELRPTPDICWPSNKPTAVKPKQSGDDEEASDFNEFAGFRYQEYWQSVRERYINFEPTLEYLTRRPVDALPDNWSVVSISTTEDKTALLVSRQRPHRESLTFCIPLSRHGRKEGDDEEQQLSYSNAIAELEEIVSASNAQAKEAVHIHGREAKASWWAERRILNQRMKELVENIEFCWLGGFKGIFSDLTTPDADAFSALRTRLESAFIRVLRLNMKGKSLPPLDDILLECYSTLPTKCRDEELEDIIYFMLDLYQLHSVPIALAEVDMDEVVVEIRSVLEETSAKFRAGGQTVVKDSHMFLVLDKNVQGIPWESIPILRGKPISRIPSLSFLLDRLEMSKFTNQASGSRGFRINPSRAYYVMNPSGDLKLTEDTFRDWAKGMEPYGWKGIIGRAPMEQELIAALEHQDLFIYFGHGNGEQFVRGRKIRSLRRCAATMIWGCSSGLMKDMGTFDRTGTPTHYMLAGCPTLVANLWDVTDRDMDKFTNSVFSKIGLTKERVAEWRKVTGQEPGGVEGAAASAGPSTTESVSVVEAVAQSRDVCKMDFLVGAAPVVYGIPFYI